jgi:hypothetical protein
MVQPSSRSNIRWDTSSLSSMRLASSCVETKMISMPHANCEERIAMLCSGMGLQTALASTMRSLTSPSFPQLHDT